MRAVTFSILALAAAAQTQDGWIDLTGRAMPEFEASGWLNVDGPPPTLASLRNKVWLLEFTATT